MAMRKWLDRSQPLAGAPGLRGVDVAAAEWRQSALDLAAGGARLEALWTECTHGAIARALYGGDDFLLLVTLPLARGETEYPNADVLPAAADRSERPLTSWLQRARARIAGRGCGTQRGQLTIGP
jgi:hypothetical protein